jgi:hypothetical protein
VADRAAKKLISGKYPENYREGNVPLDADDPHATPDRAATLAALEEWLVQQMVAVDAALRDLNRRNETSYLLGQRHTLLLVRDRVLEDLDA